MFVLRGYVEPLYEASKEKQVFITSDDGKEYIVLHKGAGMDLADLVGNLVEVSSTVMETKEEVEQSTIIVRSYIVLEG